MFDVMPVPVRETQEVRERFIDSTGVLAPPGIHERQVLRQVTRTAALGGREFVPPDRVEQAVRDAKLCRCGGCVCCTLARVVGRK